MIKTIVLYDVDIDLLYPLTYTRSISDIRIGLYTIREKWYHLLKNEIENLLLEDIKIHTSSHLSFKYLNYYHGNNTLDGSNTLYIRSNIIPNEELVKFLINLPTSTSLLDLDNNTIAYRLDIELVENFNILYYESDIININNIWNILDIFPEEIKSDLSLFKLNNPSYEDKINKSYKSVILSLPRKSINDSHEEKSNNIYYIGKTYNIHSTSCLNIDYGSIYIGDNVTIEEFVLIRGPVIICDNTIIKTHSQIKGPVVIGNTCKIGGEVEHSIIMDYTNKAHYGYLGRSIIGEWCNLGAGTTTSTLKNNYSNVRINNIDTERMFIGTFMGDHVNTAVNTVFNPGTLVGPVCNIFEDPHTIGLYLTTDKPNIIKPFTWGKINEYVLDKAIVTAKKKMKRRNVEIDIFNMFKHIKNN